MASSDRRGGLDGSREYQPLSAFCARVSVERPALSPLVCGADLAAGKDRFRGDNDGMGVRPTLLNDTDMANVAYVPRLRLNSGARMPKSLAALILLTFVAPALAQRQRSARKWPFSQSDMRKYFLNPGSAAFAVILLLVAICVGVPAYAQAQTISISDPTGGATGTIRWSSTIQVMPDDSGQTYATVVFNGTYTGTAPSNVDLRFCADGSCSTVQQTYGSCSGATIGGGNWSCPFRVQNSWSGTTTFLHVQARETNATGVTSAITTNTLAAGTTPLLIGQSNMAQQWVGPNINAGPTPNVASSAYINTPPAAVASISATNATFEWLAYYGGQSLGAGYMGLAQAIGGTDICSWVTGSVDGCVGQGASNATVTSQIAAVSTDFDAVWWNQGESNGSTQADYYADLQNVEAWTRTYRANVPFFITPVTHTVNNVRQAGLQSIDNDANVYWGGGMLDLPMQSDGVHLTEDGKLSLAKRMVQAQLRQKGLSTSGYGPVVSNLTCDANGTTCRINVTQEVAGATLTAQNLSTSGSGLNEFIATCNGSPATISSTAFNQPAQVVITLSSACLPVTNVQISYENQNGNVAGNVTNSVHDNQVPFSDSNGLPLQPTRGPLTASLTPPASVAGGRRGLFR